VAAPLPGQEDVKKDKEEPKKDDVKKEDLSRAKEEPKKEDPKVPDPIKPAEATPPKAPQLQPPGKDLVPQLVPGVEAFPLPQLPGMGKREIENARRMWNMANGPFAGLLHPQQGRLGVQVDVPAVTLVEQLDLPKDQGLVVEKLQPDSAAAKAGVKEHDILLEVDGKPVPSDPSKLVQLLQEIKADKAIDLVVLRKGKRETVKGVKLPEAKAQGSHPFGLQPVFPNLDGAQNVLPQLQVMPPNINVFGGFGGINGQGVMTSMFRSGDRYTLRHQEGTLIVTMTGKVEEGKAKLSGIQIQDGAVSTKYESVDKVPEQYRDKVKNLVEMTEKSALKIELKVP